MRTVRPVAWAFALVGAAWVAEAGTRADDFSDYARRLPPAAPDLPPNVPPSPVFLPEQGDATGAQPAPPQAPAPQYVTQDELKSEMKKFAWTKGDLQIIPYGFATASLVFETERTSPGDFAVFVLPGDTAGEPAAYVDAKSSRVGLDVLGPKLGCWGCPQTAAKIEFDFQGQFEFANRSGVLFRQAYIELKNDDYRILTGQAWEVVSELFPGMIMYVPGSGAGNLGYRRAQFRGERYLTVSDRVKYILEGSLNADIIGDFTRTAGVVGHSAAWPILEGRASVLLGQREGPDAHPITLAVSGHVGEMQYDFSDIGGISHNNAPTWSVNLEMRLPITTRFGVAGELFTGENLSSFMGGILQGVDPGTREPIRSRGGWVDVWYDWRKDLHSHAGYLIDDPFNQDLTTGRTYENVVFGNLVYNIMANFDLGFETSYWKTNWIGHTPGESVRFELQTKYRF